MRLFGLNIEKEKPKKNEPERKTFRDAIIDADDLNITSVNGRENQLGEMNIKNIPQLSYNNDVEKIQLYRKMAQSNVHVGLALTEIKNEAFIFNNENSKAFSIGFYNEDNITKSVREQIINEVNNLYNIINFKDNAIEWFENWYVDSRLFLHVIIDENKPNAGILGVVPLNPINVRKVKLLPKSSGSGVIDINKVNEVYVYKNNFKTYDLEQTMYLNNDSTTTDDIILSKDSVVSVTSGLRDKNTGKTIGHLEKAIIPYNNLRMLEEAMVIFRIVRAPMRRAFYIDVSNLQPKKGEKYIEDTKNKFKVDVNYDSNTGAMNGTRHIQSILEDYYIPRQGNRTTEIQTLEGQTNQDILDEVEYAREQLWLGLNVPKSRYKDDASTIFTRPNDIQRDEYRLNLFISKCRQQFMKFFDKLLKTQLILKNVIKEYEWDSIKDSYYYKFTEDNLFIEYKNIERLNSQIEVLNNVEPYVGTYYSREYIKRSVLKQNDKDIELMNKQINDEKENEEITDE